MRESELLHREVFRGPWMHPLAYLWAVAALLFVLDALRRGDLRDKVVVLAAVVAASAVVYALAYRPAVVVDDDAVLLRNVVRDIRIPWSAVTDVEREWVLTIEAGQRRYVAWAVSARNPARAGRAARGEAGMLPGVAMPRIGDSPADSAHQVAPGRPSEEVLERWLRRRERVPPAEVTVTYPWPLAAVLGVALVVLAGALMS